jgi:hypothetical protein
MNESSKHRSDLPVLVSRDSYEFWPDSRIWMLSRDITINLSWVDELMQPPLLDGALEAFSFYAANYSAGHTANMNHRMKRLIRFSCNDEDGINAITPSICCSITAQR